MTSPSFVTAILYGTLLDAAMIAVSFIPNNVLLLRILWLLLGASLCSVAVSLFFHTYIPPESYELIVKEISQNFSLNINKVKTTYDCISTVVSVVLSFLFFGFGVFLGIGIGTIACAFINGILIARISLWLEGSFTFKNKFNLENFFAK